MAHLTRMAAHGRGPRAKARHLRALVAHGSAGSRALTALAIRHLDEHWDGRGYPEGLAAEAISPLGRVLCLAQTMEVFWHDGGPEAAVAVARERRDTWFDPALVAAAEAMVDDAGFWATLERPSLTDAEPGDTVLLADEARLDRIAEAFAQVIDAKSPRRRIAARVSRGSRRARLRRHGRAMCEAERRRWGPRAGAGGRCSGRSSRTPRSG